MILLCSDKISACEYNQIWQQKRQAPFLYLHKHSVNYSGSVNAKDFLSLRENSLAFRLEQKQLLREMDDSDKGVHPLVNETEKSMLNSNH